MKHYPKIVSVGNKSSSTVYSQFINGVSAKVQFTFENFSPNASKISKFNIIVAPQKSGKFNVEYRDIYLKEKPTQANAAVIQKIESNNFLFFESRRSKPCNFIARL